MSKSTIIKVALVALLALPALPLLATTVSPTAHKPAAATHKPKVVAASTKHRVLHHATARNTKTTGKTVHLASKTVKKPVISSKTKKPAVVASRNTSTVHHVTVASAIKPRTTGKTTTSHNSSANDFTSTAPKVKITRTPPMIDGAHI